MEKNILNHKLLNNVSDYSADEDEYLLKSENNRLTTFPIKNPEIWKAYEIQQALFWTAKEIDFSKDYNDFLKLNQNEQHFIKMVLAFFSSADTIVNINIGERFSKDVKVREAQIVYNWQKMMEDIHSQVYSLQIENIVKDSEEKEKLLKAVENFDCVAEKANWAVKWIESKDSFARRLIGFAIGTIVFAIMSILLFGEPITPKTGVCLFLAFCILLIQLFMK